MARAEPAGSHGSGGGHSKARSVGPGLWPAQPWCPPERRVAAVRGLVRGGCAWAACLISPIAVDPLMDQ